MKPLRFVVTKPAGGSVTVTRDHLLLSGRVLKYVDTLGIAVYDGHGFLGLVSYASVSVELRMRNGEHHTFTFSSLRAGIPSEPEEERLEGTAAFLMELIEPHVILNLLLEVAAGRAISFGPRLELRPDGLHLRKYLWMPATSMSWDDVTGGSLVGNRWEIYGRINNRIRLFVSCGMNDINGRLLPFLIAWLHPRKGRVSDLDRQSLLAGQVP